MSPNVGGLDRKIRIGLGLLILLYGLWPALTGAGAAGISWLFTIIGAALLLTGFFRFCGLYSLLGMNTCSIDKR